MFTLNVPNALTVLRILLVPVLVVALLDESASPWLAAAVFALASFTDMVDGYIARAREQITTFGKLMDPVADKLLIIAALVVLVSQDRIPSWIAMVIIAREFAVTVTRLAATGQGVIISANWWGKAKTMVQVAAIFFAIGFDPTPLGVDVLLYVAVAITVVSGIDYFFGLRRLLREAEERRQASPSSQSRIDV
ncbi:MAG: CDP-diacylglycerol--glycerol-3-phosphate 3-phosphatidyltransferase [Solirubrobacteraceae bacterium]